MYKNIDDIINDYKNGLSLRKIQTKYHVNRNNISKILKENGIQIRTQVVTSKKYFADETFFDVIDTEEKAYWLGFIYADGYITTKRNNGNQSLGITLSKSDKEHLEKFKRSIKSNHPINTYLYHGFEKEGYPATECSRILIPSAHLVESLKKYGVVEHKTKILTFPEINDELKFHFIRGYLDGDGSLFIDKRNDFGLSFCGTKNFLNSVKEIIGYNQKINFYKGIYELSYRGNVKILNICNLLYKNANIYMDRKYNNYLILKNRYNGRWVPN